MIHNGSQFEFKIKYDWGIIDNEFDESNELNEYNSISFICIFNAMDNTFTNKHFEFGFATTSSKCKYSTLCVLRHQQHKLITMSKKYDLRQCQLFIGNKQIYLQSNDCPLDIILKLKKNSNENILLKIIGNGANDNGLFPFEQIVINRITNDASGLVCTRQKHIDLLHDYNSSESLTNRRRIIETGNKNLVLFDMLISFFHYLIDLFSKEKANVAPIKDFDQFFQNYFYIIYIMILFNDIENNSQIKY